MHPAAKRWLRRVGIAMVVLVVLIGAFLWWLLGSTSGLHFAISQLGSASDGAIAIQAADGDLAGPLQLSDVTYRAADTGTTVHVDHLTVDLGVWSLLTGQVHLVDLTARGITVKLTTPAQEPPESSTSFSLEPPMDVVLDHVHVSDVHIIQDGEPVFTVNTLDLAGAWTSQGLTVRQLKLRAPKGRADLSGKLELAQHKSGKAHGTFRWTLDGTTWAGTLDAKSNGETAQLALALGDPMKATLHVDIQPSGAFPWTAKLNAPQFDAEPILGDSSIKTLAIALSGHGDRTGGTLTGHVDLDQTRFQLKPLELHYHADAQKVTLDQLVLVSPQIQGTLSGHGTIDLGVEPVNVDLALDWHDVVVPEKLAGQKLASAGDITVTGSAQRYHVKGRVTVGPPDQMAHLALDLTGTPKQITLEHLTVNQPKGHLDTQGTVTLKPNLAWDLTVEGEHFNPGLLLADWKGALDIDLATQGRITPTGPDATFKLAKLEGTLRQRSLSGHGTLHVTPDRVLNGTLALASGNSRIKLVAEGTQSNHITLDLAIISLNDWMPDASGALRGEIKVNGLWPKLAVDAHLRGQKLVVSDTRVGSLDLVAKLPDISHPGGTLDLEATKLFVGGMAFDSVNLTGKGDAAHHALNLVAKGQPLSLKLALTGSMQGKAWNGTLSTLDLDMHGLPTWHLQQPAQLAWNKGQASLSKLCLTAGTPVMCLSANKARDGTLQASYQLQQIPLALIATAVGEGAPLHAQGVINGQGKVTRTAAGDLSGHATLTSPKGEIRYADRPQLPLLAYDNFNVEATLAPKQQHVTLSAAFRHGGRLEGDITVSGANQALAGHVAMRLNSSAPVELFTTALADVKGHLDAEFQFGGTVAQPILKGQAALQQFAAEVPVVGLQLHDGHIRVATTDTRELRIDGQIGSGDGTLKLAGTLSMGEKAPTHITIRGDNVLAADIPAAKVTVSPDLDIKFNDKGLLIGGSLTIDKALVKLEKLPGGGPSAVQPSPDVVIVDDKKKQKENKALPIWVDLTVNLDHHTHLIGYGLNGHVSGKLHVSVEPGEVTTGRGQIVINGTYQAYGQDLVIKQGHLLFASTPIANPGLDIRAIRALHPNATINDHQVVGLHISGTAQQPVMTVFSNPTMEQSDALSYLITGKPLSQVKGGEGNMVNAAAKALGSAAGDLLAKGIGAKLGIEAGVSSSAALGTAAFTVGKYLSPRLYLSYGVGLFDPGQVITLRYILSSRWSFEAEQATEFSRASFNYRLEN
ncbi:MAG TPA: translocation/assembly module TamB domain-containing protein [Oleiagrimonas sp.]|nr:translocation/assembly module TamB domain-containing protein [Oleiagrimonas sp.]